VELGPGIVLAASTIFNLSQSTLTFSTSIIST
jgi:hypothetical protein